MHDEAPVISNDVAILGQVISDRDVSHKRLATLLNVHLSTVYDYLNGTRTAPFALFRHVHRMTQDARIPKLLNGDDQATTVSIVVTMHPIDTPQIPKLPELLPAAIAASEAGIKSLKTLQKIVADGKVDRADAKAVAELKATILKTQELLARVAAGVDAEFKRGAK